MTPLSPRIAMLMTLPPLMWAGNAVVGRLMVGQVPPMALNALRWALAAAMLLPLAWPLLRDARERRAVRAITRADTYGRYVSVLVYLPRDRYNTAVREKFSEILLVRLGGESVEFTVRINESTTARVHFVVHLPREQGDPTVTGTLRALDTADLERRLADASRSWRDDRPRHTP